MPDALGPRAARLLANRSALPSEQERHLGTGMPVSREDELERLMADIWAESDEKRSQRFSRPLERELKNQSLPVEAPPRTTPYDPNQLEMPDKGHRERYANPATHADRASQKDGSARQASWEEFWPEEPPSEWDFLVGPGLEMFAGGIGGRTYSPEDFAEIVRRKQRASAYGVDTFLRGLANSFVPFGAANEFAAGMRALFGDGDYATNSAMEQARDRYDARHFPITSMTGKLVPTAWMKDLPGEILEEIIQELLSNPSHGSNQVNKQQPWHRVVVVRPKDG